MRRSSSRASPLEHTAAGAAAEAAADGSGAPIDWNGALAIGTQVKGLVHKIEEYGIVVDLEANEVRQGAGSGFKACPRHLPCPHSF